MHKSLAILALGLASCAAHREKVAQEDAAQLLIPVTKDAYIQCVLSYVTDHRKARLTATEFLVAGKSACGDLATALHDTIIRADGDNGDVREAFEAVDAAMYPQALRIIAAVPDHGN